VNSNSPIQPIEGEQFGDYVKRLRGELRLTQNELADLTGQSQSRISAVEKGETAGETFAVGLAVGLQLPIEGMLYAAGLINRERYEQQRELRRQAGGRAQVRNISRGADELETLEGIEAAETALAQANAVIDVAVRQAKARKGSDRARSGKGARGASRPAAAD
jgi:transcriptional regulator with XRE-family HTH domain